MRGLTRTIAAAKPSAAVFSTFSGAGRGLGRGSVSPSTTPNGSSPSPFDSPPPAGHGRGRGLPSPSSLPSFSPLPSAGRGRGRLLPPPDPDGPNQPIFFRREEKVTTEVDETPVFNRPLNLSFGVPPAGRGKERKEPEEVGSRPLVENRHLRRRPEGAAGRRGGVAARGRTGRGGRGRRLESEEDGFDLGDGVGRGGRVRGYESKEDEWGSRTTSGTGWRILSEGESRGRGRGGRARGGRGRGGGNILLGNRVGGRLPPLKIGVDLIYKGLDLGDPDTGHKLTKRLGEEEAEKLKEMMTEEISYKVLPCPREEAYKDALSMNYRIELEPEYLMEFNKNPDIDDTPPMPLREALEKMKPFLMEYESIESEEEWEQIMKDVMESAPSVKRMVDEYSGPDLMTAKEQNEELESVAKTLPEKIPSSVKRFTDRALLSLQNNPGWGIDKKKKFMNGLSFHMNQHYK